MVKYRILFLYCSWPTKRDYLLVCSTWFLALDPMLQTWERLCVRVLWWLRYPSQVPLKQERLVYMHFFTIFFKLQVYSWTEVSLRRWVRSTHLKIFEKHFLNEVIYFLFLWTTKQIRMGSQWVAIVPMEPPPLWRVSCAICHKKGNTDSMRRGQSFR